ncbi:MAG: hypothetical protein H0V82_12545 [Candidatus Protochlamydia sp.]|nr:hypothetical protein [Candidatus Protochlamydia sp.]
MTNSNNKNIQNNNTKLHIAFPKSTEDRRLQLVEINGSFFAIIHSPLESDGPIQLYCDEWSLVILASLKSKSNIVISAQNIICLSEIESKDGHVNIHASKHLVKFAQSIRPLEKISEIVEGREFNFGDDPGAYLHYYKLLENMLKSVQDGNPEALSQAQQKFIMFLCGLAEKIEGTVANLNFLKVLDIWGIPHVKNTSLSKE